MNYSNQDAQYRASILNDLSMLDELVFTGERFPMLCKVLSKGGGRRRLTALLLYFWQYGNAEPLSDEHAFILSMGGITPDAARKEKEANSISHSSQRGNEICLSFADMAALLCQDKRWDDKSWKRYVRLFVSLGLLRRYLPDQHEPAANTALQNFSLELAAQKGRRAVSWYHVPNYATNGNYILNRAEQRATAFREHGITVSNISKDNVRDVLGETVANSVFDTLNREPWEPVRETRSVFDAVLTEQLQDGWTTEAKVLEAVYERYNVFRDGELFEDEQEQGETVSEWTLKRRWKEYKPDLAKRGIKAVPPTAAERERWNLPDRRRIIIDLNRWRATDERK